MAEGLGQVSLISNGVIYPHECSLCFLGGLELGLKEGERQLVGGQGPGRVGSGRGARRTGEEELCAPR